MLFISSGKRWDRVLQQSIFLLHHPVIAWPARLEARNPIQTASAGRWDRLTCTRGRGAIIDSVCGAQEELTAYFVDDTITGTILDSWCLQCRLAAQGPNGQGKDHWAHP